MSNDMIPQPPVTLNNDETNQVSFCNGKVFITSEIEIVNGGYTVLGGERYPLTGTVVYDHTTLEV